MKLESQVCSLELAKKLKELGLRKETYFCWQETPRVGDGGILSGTGIYELRRMDNRMAYGYSAYTSAFTVAELGEMLPCEVMKANIGYSLKTLKYSDDNDFWTVEYSGSLGKLMPTHANTEADARAKMLIYLIEQGIVKP